MAPYRFCRDDEVMLTTPHSLQLSWRSSTLMVAASRNYTLVCTRGANPQVSFGSTSARTAGHTDGLQVYSSLLFVPVLCHTPFPLRWHRNSIQLHFTMVHSNYTQLIVNRWRTGAMIRQTASCFLNWISVMRRFSSGDTGTMFRPPLHSIISAVEKKSRPVHSCCS